MCSLRIEGETYIFLNNRTEAGVPQDPIPTDLIHEQPFPAEHHLAKPLTFVFLDHTLRTRNKRIFSYRPFTLPVQSQQADITQCTRRHQQLSWACERRMRHLAADEQLLDREFDRTFKSDGGAHGDHDTGLGCDRTTHRELQGHDGVCVAVADTVAAAVEGADIVLLRGARADELSDRGRTAGHRVRHLRFH